MFVNICFVVCRSSVTAGHLWMYLGKSVAAKDGMGENMRDQRRELVAGLAELWVLRFMSGDVWSLAVHQATKMGHFLPLQKPMD